MTEKSEQKKKVRTLRRMIDDVNKKRNKAVSNGNKASRKMTQLIYAGKGHTKEYKDFRDRYEKMGEEANRCSRLVDIFTKRYEKEADKLYN